MAKKTFNQKLQDNRNLPKVVEINDSKAVSRYGGTRLLIASPLAYDEIMKKYLPFDNPEGI